jgi:hypothetical protein
LSIMNEKQDLLKDDVSHEENYVFKKNWKRNEDLLYHKK